MRSVLDANYKVVIVMRVFIAIVLSCVFYNLSAHASNKSLEAKVLQPIGWLEMIATSAQRSETAAAIKGYWEDFSSRVPRLSPAEEAWLNTELAQTENRMNRALESREFALSFVIRHVESCLENTSGILDAINHNISSELEMFFWVKLLNCYNEIDDVRIYLHRAGLSDGRWDGPFYFQGAPLIRSRITNIIIPSAMAETMGWTLGEP